MVRRLFAKGVGLVTVADPDYNHPLETRTTCLERSPTNLYVEALYIGTLYIRLQVGLEIYI